MDQCRTIAIDYNPSLATELLTRSARHVHQRSRDILQPGYITISRDQLLSGFGVLQLR